MSLQQHTIEAARRQAGKRRYNRLPAEAVPVVVKFIQKHHSEFAHKTACLRAALKEAGLEGAIEVTTSAANRYFDKAMVGKSTAATQSVQLNYGCNLHLVALGLAMATNLKSS